MSNETSDCLLEPLCGLKKAVARLWSPKPQLANLNSAAANRSATPILRTPSSASRAVDAGPVVASEITDDPAATIGYDQVEHRTKGTGDRSRNIAPSVYPPISTTYPSNLPINRGLASADHYARTPKSQFANIGTTNTDAPTTVPFDVIPLAFSTVDDAEMAVAGPLHKAGQPLSDGSSNLPIVDPSWMKSSDYPAKTEVGVINNYKEVQNVNTGDNYGLWIQNVNNQDLDKDIRTWLSPPDSSRNYHAASAILQNQPASCVWFLNGMSFSKWLEEPGFLWIKGKSGCGKTILSSAIINHLLKSQPSLVTAYFFFDGRDSQKELQLHDKLIRSLIWQFSLKSGDDVPKVLTDLYFHCGKGYQQPSLDDLHNVLQRILGGIGSAYIILDALDECSERDKVLDWVQTVILHKDENLRLHLIATSRPEKDIYDKFNSYVCVDLVKASENHDIEDYLEDQLQTGWQKWPPEIQDEIKSTLRKQADGMFRWVALQLIELKKCRTRKAIREQLNNLPEGLDETYDQILLAIEKRDCSDTKTFLLWLCFAVRPMTLKELAATVTVDLAAKNGPQFECENKIEDISDILKMCSSFVIESESEIKLAHFSIKEYLLSKHVKEHHDEQVKAFSLGKELSHLTISQTCLAYLLQFKTSEMAVDFPLMDYAAKYWIFHTQSSNDDKSQESYLSELMMKLLIPDNAAFVNWVKIYDWWNASTELPPLYYVCEAGLIKATLGLLKNGVDVNMWMNGRYSHVLQVASCNGREAIAKLLIENGADVNAQGGHYGNALEEASVCGHEAIAKLLIESGADVNAIGGHYGNALQAVSYHGHYPIAKLLIENGADVNAQGEHGNALQAASYHGHYAIAKLVIENGADVNAQGEHKNALQAATFKGHEAIAKLLIDNGANVNAQEGEHGNILQAALSWGYEPIAKLLIENGADVNAQGGYHGNALQAALFCGQESIARLLIESGAEVNAQGGEYGNALQAASSWGYEAVVKVLIENGADVNTEGGHYGNALQAASSWGYEAIAKLLVENGADVNVQGGHYKNALQAASYKGQEAIAKLLIENGAEVNAQGGEHGNILQAALFWGHEGIAKLLIENGADVNAQGGYHGNALQAALFCGQESIAKLLIESGAEVNAQGGEYGNALQAASSLGYEGIVKLLIENGADVNAQVEYYGNALQASSSWGYEAIAKLLMATGADVNAQGGAYGNALQAASYWGYEAIVELLIEKGAIVNAQGGEYGNALQAASVCGHKAIAKLLIENGADVNAQGGEYGNALQAASSWGYEAIVKLLIENGADVNAQGGYYGNALQAASSWGQESIAKLLVENWADVNAQGGHYRNALQAASSGSYEALVKLLIENGAIESAQGIEVNFL